MRLTAQPCRYTYTYPEESCSPDARVQALKAGAELGRPPGG